MKRALLLAAAAVAVALSPTPGQNALAEDTAGKPDLAKEQ